MTLPDIGAAFAPDEPLTIIYNFLKNNVVSSDKSYPHYIQNLKSASIWSSLGGVDPSVTPSTTLQSLVNNATPGSTLLIPDGVYREKVTINKTLTLVPQNQGKVSIRSTDFWPDWYWAKPSWWGSSRVWVSGPAIPAIAVDPNGQNFVTTNCEEVFRDGKRVHRIGNNRFPKPGEWSLDQNRKVWLGDDPFGHLMEVTTRDACLVATGPTRGANTVTLKGLDLRHSASQLLGTGAGVRSNSDGGTGTGQVLIVDGCNICDHHGCGVGGAWAPGSKITNSIMRNNGGFGYNFNQDFFVPGGSVPVEFSTNIVVLNNVLGYSVGFGAGGGKISSTDLLNYLSNTILGNNGVGWWSDGNNTRHKILNNVSAFCEYAGGMFEISGARNDGSGNITYTGIPSEIAFNTIYECGWSLYQPFQIGGGLLISTSVNVGAHDNLIAWCWNPLAVWWDSSRSSNLKPVPAGTNTPSGIVTGPNNKVIEEGSFSAVNAFNSHSQLIKFIDQQSNHVGGAAGLYWNGGGNGAWGNQVWAPVADGAWTDQYQYDGNLGTLAALNTVGTGGNSGGNLNSRGATTLIDPGTTLPVPASVAAILTAAGVPTAPQPGHGSAWQNAGQNSAAPRVVHITASTALDDQTRVVYIDCTTASVVITLPDGNSNAFAYRDPPAISIIRVDASANTCTIQGSGSQQINQGANITITNVIGTRKDLNWDGVGWYG